MPKIRIPGKSLQLWLNPNRQATLEALLSKGWDVRNVIVAWDRGCENLAKYCAEQGVPFSVAGASDPIPLWNDHPAAVLLSVGYGKILERDLLDTVPLAINIHPSLLPRYRGRSTVVWGLAHGDKECGLTCHIIDCGIDTGAILAQHALPLSPFDTPRSLLRKIFEAEPTFALEVLETLLDEGLSPTPQTEQDAPLLPNREPSHGELDPSLPLQDLYNAIRASDPKRFPAYFYVEGQKVCVRLWRPEKPEDEEDMI